MSSLFPFRPRLDRRLHIWRRWEALDSWECCSIRLLSLQARQAGHASLITSAPHQWKWKKAPGLTLKQGLLAGVCSREQNKGSMGCDECVREAEEPVNTDNGVGALNNASTWQRACWACRRSE
eukprot:1150646-Pelagomonas_calceolata.AAC.5